MRRLNDYRFYELGVKLGTIERLENTSVYKDVFFDLYSARIAVNELFELFPLQICMGAAQELIKAISGLVPAQWKDAIAKDQDAQIGSHSYWIGKAKEAFENVLSAELSALDTYILTQHGIYNTAYLVDHAEMALSQPVLDAIPEEAKTDFRYGGRCLAFELATASGFHTMRATEAVLRRYHRLVTGLAAGAKSPEMAQCINELRAKGEDPKILNILDGIRDLHRNPQMHPDAFLTMDEATRLFDISKSAISAMADRIAALSPSTSAASAIAAAMLGSSGATGLIAP